MKKLSYQEISQIEHLTEKMGCPKSKKLFFKLALKIGVNGLERNIGLVLEDPKIRNKTAYLIKLCQTNQQNNIS